MNGLWLMSVCLFLANTWFGVAGVALHMFCNDYKPVWFLGLLSNNVCGTTGKGKRALVLFFLCATDVSSKCFNVFNC